ncbi:MAG: cytochrome C [Campylobacterales bacterium]|nr:cytochrome C [Campylobacterales bacterium]
MKNITKVVLSALLLLSVGATTASADAKKGQVLYLKKLKKACGINGGEMAAKHTMAEWKKLYEGGKLAAEIQEICPSAKEKSLQDKFLEHYFDFFHEYAKDSGNIPAC